jgi:hypothetical protein
MKPKLVGAKCAAFLCLIFVSCDSESKRLEKKWIGKSYSDLVGDFGFPDNGYTTGLKDPGPGQSNRGSIVIRSVVFGARHFGLNYKDEIISIRVE